MSVLRFEKAASRFSTVIVLAVAFAAPLPIIAQAQMPAPATEAPGETAPARIGDETAIESIGPPDRTAPLADPSRALEEKIKALWNGRNSPDTLIASAAGAPPNPQGSTGIDTKSSPRPTAITNEWGVYTTNLGFKLANVPEGDLSVSIYTYFRYLDQNQLDPTYTNAFGQTKNVKRRQDMQLQKVQFKFLGWIMDPKFRYFLYGWTSNANQGLGAQVVLAGNMTYAFRDFFALGFGITSLPGTRSVEGNFPFWLGVDTRLITDEYFRPSYTTGVYARGQITDKLRYQIMLGNNLSTLGVSALQLDGGLNTVSSALVWTTNDYGPGWGDFENHTQPAFRLGAHFTRSDENKESQPGEEAPDNTQIRISDGSVIFTQDLFGPGITVHDVRYRMTTADGGIKYRGWSLEGEYYWRWLDDFRGSGVEGLPNFFDHGYQIQASAMVAPKSVQIYLGQSTLFGQFGQPWDARAGVNVFPFKNKVVRWNTEALYLHRSPVGYTSVPFTVGGKGFVFHTNVEMAF